MQSNFTPRRDFVAAAMALVHAAPAADVPERAVFAATKDLQLLGGKAGVDLSVVLCWFFANWHRLEIHH